MRLIAALVLACALAPAQQNNLANMNAIASALGVQCAFCHAGGQGRGRGVVSSAPSHMEIARQMMIMTADLNTKVQTITGKSPTDATRVTCVTCHRGVSIPGQLSDIITATDVQKGVEAAVQQYRDLRSQYYGRQSYDFGEDTLVTAATTLANTHPDDAVALLNLNLEFFPQSVSSWIQIAYAYTRKIDDPDAIIALEKALELQPNNGAVKGRLEQLKAYQRNRK
jgi:tetratricopeptide (TPR) repeat protein